MMLYSLREEVQDGYNYLFLLLEAIIRQGIFDCIHHLYVELPVILHHQYHCLLPPKAEHMRNFSSTLR